MDFFRATRPIGICEEAEVDAGGQGLATELLAAAPRRRATFATAALGRSPHRPLRRVGFTLEGLCDQALELHLTVSLPAAITSENPRLRVAELVPGGRHIGHSVARLSKEPDPDEVRWSTEFYRTARAKRSTECSDHFLEGNIFVFANDRPVIFDPGTGQVAHEAPRRDFSAGFRVLAPTFSTHVPSIRASELAVMATAAGSVVVSVAVAASIGAARASFQGSKMARRIGSVKEFEFKPIGNNHNKGRLGVNILVPGFAFEVKDFWRTLEGWKDNLEKYTIAWPATLLAATDFIDKFVSVKARQMC